MENDKEANQYSHWLWIGLMAAFVLLGSVLFMGVETPDFAALNFGDKTSDMADELDRLSIEYVSWIKPIDSYKDFWGFVCIGGGVLSAIAIALRAPQPMIIIPSATVAFVFAALQFHSPDKLLDALTDARRSINCLKHPAKALIVAEETHLPDAASTLLHLEKDDSVLLEYTVKLTSITEDITSLLSINQDKYTETKNAIYQVLISSDTEVDLTLVSELMRLASQAQSVINALEDIPTSDKEHLAPIEFRLKAALSDIQNALNIINSSATLKKQIKADVDSFTSAKEALTLALEKSKSDLLNVNYARSQMKDSLDTLKEWPDQLNLSTNLVSRQATTVHNDLLLKISKTEPSTQDILAIVKGVAELGTVPAEVAPETPAAAVNPVRTFMPPRGPKAAIELSTLETSVSMLESEVKALLEKSKADIERQKVIGKLLANININDNKLAMLNSAQLMYQDSITSSEQVFSTYSANLADTLKSLEKVATLNSKVNFTAINEKIASCSPQSS